MHKENLFYDNLIESKSIILKTDKWVCETPEGDNNPETGGNYFIRYFTVLTNNGQLMRNTPVQIYSSIRNDIEEKIVITTDPDNEAQNPEIIKPVDKFVNVTSDPNGRLSFRVYPIKGITVVLQLGSKLPDSERYYPAPTVYIINPKYEATDDSLSPPVISGLNGDELRAHGSSKMFDVNIPPYDTISNTNTVIFFTHKNDPISPAIKISNAEEPDYTFKLYFDSFPLNEASELYYTIIPESGNNKYSPILGLTYTGGGDNQPSDEFSRPLDPPVIYSSLARPPLDASDDEYIIQEYDIVNLDTIDDYRNNGGIDLFIKIVGTSDLNGETKPKFGDKVFLVMYVNSSSKIINKSMPVTIKTVVGENTSTNIIPIPHEMLVDIASYSDTGYPGVIYFEYYIDSEGIRTYSKDWQSQISTVSPGGGDN
ncbi:hypothetical protein [Xenorhabdus bovienii]|uniref:hypothetical protein n=1 Tax=Xenorhabdus bovienii TaxID=40576 RepID=UPI00237D05DA|nr:hypothetical protein [Xenorhabdus bovienii]MDE1475798.1 hypothetical protein [Xenorhabdus bovienii]MDE9466806.1 hypothetical protein [Xenorhabdus bovienii]